jgi:hypothetical protein
MLFNLIRPIIYILYILYCGQQHGKDETGAQVQASNYAVPRPMHGTTDLSKHRTRKTAHQTNYVIVGDGGGNDTHNIVNI